MGEGTNRERRQHVPEDGQQAEVAAMGRATAGGAALPGARPCEGSTRPGRRVGLLYHLLSQQLLQRRRT